MAYTVTQNTSFLTFASILQKVISFVYFTLVARYLGVSQTGEYFFALTFTTIFTVVADFGLGPVFTREAAKYPGRIPEFLATVWWSKIALGVCTYALILGSVKLLNFPASTALLIAVSGVTVLFDNLQAVFYSLLRAEKNLLYESVAVVASQLLTLIIGAAALFNHWPLYTLILAYTIPSFFNTLAIGLITKYRYKEKISWKWDKEILKMFIRLSWPFALASIIGRLYAYGDSVLVSKLLSGQELGWWSVPSKITTAFQFIPAALAASVYPAMSNLVVSNPLKITALFEKSWRYLFLIVLPIVVGIAALAEPIMIKIFTAAYLPSVPALLLLLPGMFFGFLATINGSTLNAVGKQRQQTVLLAVVLVTSFTLNFLLLPRLGIRGAALTELISNLLLCLAGFYLVKQAVGLQTTKIFKMFNQILWPAVGMGALVWFLSQKMNFLLTIPLGAVIYILLLLVTRGVIWEEIKDNVSKLRHI